MSHRDRGLPDARQASPLAPRTATTCPHRPRRRGRFVESGLAASTSCSGQTGLVHQLAGVRTEIANLETRLIRWMVGTVLATGGLTFAILRFLG